MDAEEIVEAVCPKCKVGEPPPEGKKCACCHLVDVIYGEDNWEADGVAIWPLRVSPKPENDRDE